MKKIVLASLAAGLAVPSVAAAEGYYGRADFGLGVSGEFEGDSLYRSGSFTDRFTQNFDFEEDYNLGAAFGKTFGPYSVEGELRISAGDAGSSSGGGWFFSSATPEFNTISAFVNGYYHIDTGGPITPFVGAGLGIAEVEAKFLNVSVDFSEDVRDAETDETALTYQFIAGASYDLSDTWTFEAGYRYQTISDVELEVPGTFEGGKLSMEGDIETSLVTVGLRRKFGF